MFISSNKNADGIIKRWFFSSYISFLLIIGSTFFIAGCGLVEDMVATDLEEQYNLASKSGDKIGLCVQAGLVSAGYLQAKNESKYLEWKDVEKRDCAAAGIPK